MEEKRHLIVNADDFGQSPGINAGIIQAHERGVVSSASLMVRWPAAAAAASYAREHPALRLGLHLDLGEWAYRNGTWEALYTVVPDTDAAAVADEVVHQLACFEQLVGRRPAHLDSHQHVHRRDPLRTLLLRIANELAIPLRHFTPARHYCGAFYGQLGTGEPYPEGISVEGLITLIRALQPGCTELLCHPAAALDFDSMYRQERLTELATLCDPRVRAALEEAGIEVMA